MTPGDMDEDAYESYLEAGEILRQVLDEAADRVEVGATQLSVAEFAEERIRELGGENAFPANISVDEEASHASPGRDDDAEFGEELVCLDCGVHVDGWIADAAVTIDLAGESDELVEASEQALEAAIASVEPGRHTGEIGAAIEAVVRSYEFNPIVNLTGHGLGHYDAHTEPNIPNVGIETGVELEPGDVFAIEPFVTTGSGRVNEGGKTEIYSLENERSVRNRRARQLLETVSEEYGRLPFAARWIDQPRAEMSLRRLTNDDVLRSYPVLKEDDGALVAQAEHTVIVTEDGCEVTTR